MKTMLVVVSLLAMSVAAWGQGSFGGLTGNITDQSGAVIPDASIKVVNLNTAATHSGNSTAEGVYLIGGLPPGKYRVSVTKAGFKTATHEPIEVSTATTTTLNLVLAVGEVTQTVEVVADVVQLQTSSPEIGTVMPEKDMLDLPISLGGAATSGASGRRQIENFIFLTPGVTGNQWSKQINGAPGFSQEILIDGIDMQTLGAPGFIAEATPPYEGVSEFKVQNTLYPAEYGLGFGVENFSLKSGTNSFHGNAFEFLRNDILDARGFFNSDKPPLRQNEFGGTFGGPIKKDKTHFFGAYSGFTLRGGLPRGGLVTLPTVKQRLGDFSDYPAQIFDPATTRPDGQGGFVRTPFEGNIIPDERISPIAKRAIELLPNPDITGAIFNNYIDRSFQPSTEHAFSVKVDQVLSDNQRLSGAFWHVTNDTVINGPVAGEWNPGFRKTPTNASGIRLNHFYNISPNLLNHFGFGYTLTEPTWTLWKVDDRKGNQILQIPGIPADANGFPDLYFDRTTGQAEIYHWLGNAQENGFDPQRYTNWTWVDDLSWVKGRHQLKFGTMLRLRNNRARDLDNVAGTFEFSQLSTSQPNSPEFSNLGNAFASFLLGEVFSSFRQIPAPLQNFRDWFWSGYVDDAIKLTPTLTLSLGLRYEIPSYVTEKDGIFSFLDLNRPNPGADGRPGALVFLGDGSGRTGSKQIFPGYHKSLSPRVGLSYAMNPKTVFRLGYGLFRIYPNYGRVNSGIFWNSGFGLLQSVSSTDQGITPAFRLDDGWPAPPVSLPSSDPSQNNGGSGSWINQDGNRPALMQSWTFNIQRELPLNILLDVAYIGSKTNGLWTGLEDINQVDSRYLSLGNTLNADIDSPEAAAAGITRPYPSFQGSVAQGLRAFPQYTTIWDMFQPTGYSLYNSLQIRLQKRYSNGLSFLGAYTLSKNIGFGGSDTFGDIFGGGGNKGIDTFNRKLEKAIESIDQTHVFVFSWTYELPFGRNKRIGNNWNPVLNHILGGWQINSIERYQSGAPLRVRGGPGLPLFGGANRPNWVSSNVRTSVDMGSFDPATDRYLNMDAFSQPAPFTIGNSPRTMPSVRAPAFYNEDFSVFKRVYIRESKYLEFRAEFFNLFNRVVFGGPSANLNSPDSFGLISSQANTPRIIQLALKFVF
jgi:Carboxypeptidase regulatory-like domain